MVEGLIRGMHFQGRGGGHMSDGRETRESKIKPIHESDAYKLFFAPKMDVDSMVVC